MELLQLSYFCDAAQTENLSQTAKKYRVPSSNISQSIKRLEIELGVQLFTRYANKLRLNENGHMFYEKISQALALINCAVTDLEGNDTDSSLSICVNVNRRLVIQAVEKFKQQYPHINIDLKHLADPKSENFDLIISNEEKCLDERKRIKLFSEPFALAVRRDSSFFDQHITRETLKSKPFITMSENSSLFRATIQICSLLGFEPQIAMKCDDPFYVRKCVELGLGVTIVPQISWKGGFGEQVVLIPISGYERVTYVYINRQKAHTPKYVFDFITILEEECHRAVTYGQ